MKYYKLRKPNKFRKQYIKVYDSVPEDQPENFRKSKLAYLHEISITFHGGGLYTLENCNSYMDPGTLDCCTKYTWAESTEEEFNAALESAKHLEEEFNKIWDQ